ncbi:MAG: hypothetical protein HY907_07955 [Deltaproteobacteria bacterium]|nr:hypothetical protein [Deltaproteobacteria bacterium]
MGDPLPHHNAGPANCTSPPAPPPAPTLPPRPARVAAVQTLLGPTDPSAGQLALGIRGITHRNFDRHVAPLVDQHWPALRHLPFFAKLRLGACDLYASAPYTVLFCASQPPLLVHLVTTAGDRLPLPAPALGFLGRAALEVLGRVAYPQQHRRIVQIASFIVVVDHVLDHCLDGPPDRRGALLHAVIDGIQPPATPELALTRALVVAMGHRLEPDEQAAFEAAMLRVHDWIRAEVRAMNGEPDPEGLGHRRAGTEGTIDGLLFPLVRWTGEGARRWMYDVAMFMQILDDWFDAEADLAVGRSTPVLEGRWTFDDLERAWHGTVEDLESLVRAAGTRSPHYVRFVRQAYVLMLGEVIDMMARRPEL